MSKILSAGMFGLPNLTTEFHYISMDPISKPRTRMSFESARISRLAAVQAYFQICSTSRPAQEVITEFKQHRFTTDDYPCEPDMAFFENLVLRTVARDEDLSALISANLLENRDLESLDSVLRSILKVGAVELLESIVHVPVPVIISEYLDLTKGFIGQAEANLTNAVLDSIAKALGLSLSKSNATKPIVVKPD